MKKIIFTILMVAMTATTTRAQDNPEPWDGSTISEAFIEHDGIIEIYTPADLAAIHSLWESYRDGDRGYSGWTIKLMNDIDLNNHNFHGLTIGWYDGHRFGGNFDGQGHIIKNLKIHGNDDNRALFGWIDNARIENLKVMNVDICASDGGGNCHIGGLCGRMEDHSTISHCAVVGGTVKGTEDDTDEVGAIVGYMKNNSNDILYCYSDVTVEGGTQIGGIVGKVEKGDDSSVRHCYFVGKVKHHGDEYFGAIAGERYGEPMENNFFLDRKDGVRATGNSDDYDGSSYHSNRSEIKECTEEEMKSPLLFGMFGKEDTEYIYPLNSYPELKVFMRYNIGDTFYNKSIGCMDNNADNAVPGYLRIQKKKENSPYDVSLEKVMPGASGTDFALNSIFTPYFSDKQMRLTGLCTNVFEGMGTVNTVTVPETIDSIAYPQRHQIQNAFILNGTTGAVKDNVLYDVTRRNLITAPKSLSTLTIHQEYADSIVDYAFENMSNLHTIYVDTWVPAGTLVDDNENPAPVMQLKGENIFNGCPADLDVYIKDGTSNQLFLGYQGPEGHGYSNDGSGWTNFYSDYADTENHMYTYFPVTRNPGGISTLILGYPVELPDGVTAWWAESFSDDYLNVRKLGTQIVPAYTPVLLTYEGNGPLYLSRYDGPDPGAATDFESNLFKGSVDPGGHTMTSSEMMSNFFTLGRPAGDSSYDNLGFYQYHPKNGLLPSYVAWLASSDVPHDARMSISFDEGEITGITETAADSNHDHECYSLTGQRVTRPAKGLYIVDGRKVFIR